MVTGSARTITAAVLVISLAGCAGQVALPEKGAQPRALDASAKAPLPRQEYTGDGKAIPYQADPNPYVADGGKVAEEARRLFSRAAAAQAAGHLDEAAQGFNKVADTWPELSGPWVKLAEIATARDNAELAERHYRKAIEINRANVNAYIGLALLYRSQGRFGDAQATYLAALRLWKDFADAHLNLAILYDLYVNKPALAQQHYEAYGFLTQGKDPRVEDWLTEIRRRTGIQKSFIKNPPAGETTAEVKEQPLNVASAPDAS